MTTSRMNIWMSLYHIQAYTYGHEDDEERKCKTFTTSLTAVNETLLSIYQMQELHILCPGYCRVLWRYGIQVQCSTYYTRVFKINCFHAKKRMICGTKNVEQRGRRWQDAGESYVMRSVIICKVKKVKCTLVQALRLCTGRTAHGGIRGIALPFLDHSTRRG